ncbi:endo-1 [Pyricularia oryzae]|nr:endo-1 [Pyricularia oryzae]
MLTLAAIPRLLAAAATMLIVTAHHDYTTSEAGNPFVDGWYADPDCQFYRGEYWVYPTSSYPYEQQTYLDAFSSPDLVNWTKHPRILTNENVTWAHKAMWAPSPISRNGKYYLYFGANDIQTNDELGGIGVGVADRPGGPYVDALGRPLIDKFHNGAQPIDQNVFIDDDGQAYIYYGGWSHCNVAKLNEDMISLGTFDDGTTYKEITPDQYVEGALMMKRNGRYYFFWSEGGWTGPDYAVSYAIADSPLGPFNRIARILQQDPAVATGSGHNGVLKVPGTDIHYIVYHRHPLGDQDGNHRQLAYDRIYFNPDGTIQPITMLVKDNFADGNMIGWQTYGGNWSVHDGHLFSGDGGKGDKAALNVNFGDQVLNADITLISGEKDAGLIFRASQLGQGEDLYSGYYAGISASGYIVLGRAVVENGTGTWHELHRVKGVAIETSKRYHLRIRAVGNKIDVLLGDMGTPKITFEDGERIGQWDAPASGTVGVRVHTAVAQFDNISVAKA